MGVTIRDDNDGRWNTMCEWLTENIPLHSDVRHSYIVDTDNIELTFAYDEDCTAFKLKFNV